MNVSQDSDSRCALIPETGVCRHAARNPDKVALISESLHLTYSQLWRYAQRTADWLKRHGVATGNVVVIAIGDADPWFVVVYVAAHLSGAIAMPTDSSRGAGVSGSAPKHFGRAFSVGREALAEIRRYAVRDDIEIFVEELPDRAADDIADVLLTSGTTDQPKGVSLSYRNIGAATRNIVGFVGNRAQDIELLTVPLTHSFGLGRLRASLMAGGTLILIPGLMFPSLVFRVAAEHLLTGICFVPAGVEILMRLSEKKLAQLSSTLRYVELGSAPMMTDTKRRLMAMWPATRICMHYGLTEASRTTFLEFHSDSEHLDSVGRPAAGTEVGVCNVDGEQLGVGEQGLIRIRGEIVMKGYWRDPALTAATLRADGWMHTADLGSIDERGYLYLHGREDDLINVGGKKVNPISVERAAVEFPGVKEAACVGDDCASPLQTVPVLFIVCEQPESLATSRLVRYLRTRVESHAVPRRVQIVSSLPKTASGKLLRAELRRGRTIY